MVGESDSWEWVEEDIEARSCGWKSSSIEPETSDSGGEGLDGSGGVVSSRKRIVLESIQSSSSSGSSYHWGQGVNYPVGPY